MKVYGVEFNITEECVDKHKIEDTPGEGTIIPLLLERIDGFYDYLLRNRCVRNDKIEMIYIFSVTKQGEVLCAKYSDGDVSIIQDVGKIDFIQKMIT